MGKRREEFAEEYDRASSEYSGLGITREIEAAVIRHLVAIKAASTCYATGGGGCDSSKCTDPDRPNCTETTTHNCICTH